MNTTLKYIFIATLFTISCQKKKQLVIEKNEYFANIFTTKIDSIKKETNNETTKSESITNDKLDTLLKQTTIDTQYNNYLVGKTNFSEDKGFVIVDRKYSSKKIYLRTQVYEAFLKMNKEAQKSGIKLIIISGARSFSHQKEIWERKWANLPSSLTDKEKALKILKFSSMPMSSRHHWGTDFDLNSLDNDYFEYGEGLKIYKWLVSNAPKHGFCQVYTDKKTNNRSGYEMEKWHWSYIPLAREVLERYNRKISINNFNGFLGSNMAADLNIIKDYVNGIAPCY